MSAYINRPDPSLLIVSPDAWACQEPVNGAIPGTSAAACGANASAAIANPASEMLSAAELDSFDDEQDDGRDDVGAQDDHAESGAG
jgi:hypothetical protein